jgi:hypothetical protein
VRKRVLLILNSFADDPGLAGKQLENATHWYDDLYGWARRIPMESVAPGLRCIYYVWHEKREMIVVKFGTHADDVYEDGN